MNDCQRILTNEVARVVHWRDGPDVSSLDGKPIWLRIAMRSAKLFAFQFTAEGKE